MTRYLIQRLLSSTGIIVALLVFVFLATHYIGDPIFLLVDSELNTEADRQALIERHGFDEPIWEQFVDYVSNALHGDFGNSIFQNRPATEIVVERIPATVLLAASALLFAFLVSIPLAIIGARNVGRWPDRLITVVSTALASVASFWLALGLIFVFAVQTSILPTSGYGSWQQLILPTLALSLPAIGQITQVVQASLQEELFQPYVVAARARGLTERAVMVRHALRNTLIVTVTMLGTTLAVLLNGTVLIESIFAWPGVGQVGLQAVQNRDLPVLAASVFYIGVVVTVINLLVDLAYVALDPRVRLA